MATDYYVAKSGSDSNPGTANSPWLTIQKAADTMQAGDTVFVSEGTYSERVVSRAHGSAGKYIRFIAADTGTVSMKGFELRHDYIYIKGFDLTGSGLNEYTGYIEFESGCDYCYVTQNRLHDGQYRIFGFRLHKNTSHCTCLDNVLERLDWIYIDISGSYHLVEGNSLSDCPGWDAIRFFGHDHVVRGNRFTHVDLNGPNHTDLFQTFGVNGDACYNILVECNYAIDCDTQIGNFEDNEMDIRDLVFRNNVFINVASSANMFCEKVYWYNNTFYNCATRNNNCVLYFSTNPTKGTAHNCVAWNNIFFGCGGTNDPNNGWYSVSSGVTGFKGDYNFVAQKNWLPKTGFNEPHGINGGNPMFIDPAGGDLTVSKDSPVVGKGTTIPGFNNDIDGNIRSSAWDIGAYEFVPEPPKNLFIDSSP